MPTDQNRAFHYAVLASIVLHALVLFGISPRERSRLTETQPPIVARLMDSPASAPPTPAPSVIQREVRPPRTAPAKPRPKRKVEAAKPVEKAAPAPDLYPAAEPRATPEIPAAPQEAPPPQIARADPGPPSAVADPVSAPPDPMTDPLAVEKYRLQINGAAANYKHYPRVARENNWEGRVSLRMVFGPGGRLESLDVIRTSGYDVLDKQAAEMFRNAAKAVPVPPLLRGKEFSVDVAVAYDLTD